MAATTLIFWSLFLLVSDKVVEAENYRVDNSNLPNADFPGGRPLSYYGMSAGSALQGGSAIPINEINNVPAGQYINGAYSARPVYYNPENTSINSANDVSLVTIQANGFYSSNSYSNNSYKGASYIGSSYSGAQSYSSDTYGENSYLAQSYSGSSYSSGSYYGGSSYGGSAYGGISQSAGVAGAISKCEPYLKYYLGYSKNNNPDEVKKLQEFLNKYESNRLLVNGVFDLPTLEAVKRFQDKYAKDVLKSSWGLSCNTGYVYITTLAKVNDIVCNTATDFSKIFLPDPRPVFRCSGDIDPVTKQAEPCAAVILPTTGTSTVSSNSSDQSNPINSDIIGEQPASVGLYGKMKGFWKEIITD